MQVQKVQNQKAIDNALFKKLQELTIKMPNDPSLYASDVQMYMQMFRVEFDKVQGDTMKKNQRFGDLLIFLARSVKHFPQKLGWIPGAVMKLMEQLGPTLNSYIRKKCVGSIMILRAKSILLPVSTIEFLLRQMRLEDKELRSMVYKYVVNDIRRMNSHHKNNKINQQIRAFISGYIPKHTDKTSQKSLKLMIELYKKNIWTDNRTVNIIAEACFAPSSRLRQMACHFLMDTTMPLDELPESEDEAVNPSEIKAKKGINRQTKHRQNKIEKDKRKAARRLRKREIQSRNVNFMPIDLIYNPQVFVQKLFNIMNSRGEKYAHKLVYMSLIGRVIWRHQLILLPFYRGLIKFLDPKQAEVSQVLTALAESIHQIVPEDQIQSIVKHIIEHFVNDRCSEFTMTIGLNTLREIFKKMPSIINEQMMLYLATYYDYRNKNVSRAAKSVINFVREYNPRLLEKRFRGNNRENDENEEVEQNEGPIRRIPGVELLQKEGKIPLEMDRILTDEDFKTIKKLMRRKEEEQQRGKHQDNQINYSDEEQDQDQIEEQKDDQIEDEQEDDGQVEDIQVDDDYMSVDDSEEDIQIDDDQIQDEGEQLELDSDQSDQILDQQCQNEQLDDSESVQSEIDWQNGEEQQYLDEASEEQPKKKSKKTKKIEKPSKKQKKNQKKKVQQSEEQEEQEEQQSDSQFEQESEQDDNHGFIAPNQIAYYKMSKTQLKANKTQIKESKEKFKHKPKDKKGGSTNREKQRFKPLMMVRAKKNKIRSNEKQLKIKIKHLKNQLGKVRSGKQAKKMKNKIIHKK